MVTRAYVIAGCGAAAVIAGLVLATLPRFDEGPSESAAPPASSPGATVPPTVEPEAPDALGPSADVARVSRQGDVVVAGRARPRSRIVLLEGETVVGEATTDDRGEWVMIPEAPLAPGEHTLRLEVRSQDGDTAVRAGHTLVLVVPAPAGDRSGVASALTGPPLAVAVPDAGAVPATLLQPPDGDERVAGVVVDAVDYDDRGGVVVSGRAPPESALTLYLDDDFVGRTTADADGRWRLRPEQAVAVGRHRLRADQLGPSGTVEARAEIAVERPTAVPASGRPGDVVVRRGDSLWMIARTTYGDGRAFTVIHAANRDQIRDPDLIYPGQVFALPAGRRPPP